jgi:glycosyltransferase involved in cell wall biosynthesis
MGNQQNLLLILTGKNQDIEIIKNRIEKMKLIDTVSVRIKVPFEELALIYQNALALLIPLSSKSTQDQARFSQKIAEYLSSKRPIITVNTGEIPYYFKNRETAFIANNFEIDDLLKEFQTVASNIKLAKKIGISGYELGKREFDYRLHGEKLHNFVSSL